MNTTSNAVQMNNREFFRQREAAALCRIPGVRELMSAQGDQRPALGRSIRMPLLLWIFSPIPLFRIGSLVPSVWMPILPF